MFDGLTAEQARKLYRQLMKENHPDAGGDPEKAKEINDAYDKYQKFDAKAAHKEAYAAALHERMRRRAREDAFTHFTSTTNGAGFTFTVHFGSPFRPGDPSDPNTHGRNSARQAFDADFAAGFNEAMREYWRKRHKDVKDK